MQTRPHTILTLENDRSPGFGVEKSGAWTVRWWIGSYVLDTTRRELTRSGVEVPVEPKVFDLIAALAEADGAMLSKAQLRERIWPDTRVTPASLRRLVKEARRALGRDEQRPDPIVTLHGRGYRLAVPALREEER